LKFAQKKRLAGILSISSTPKWEIYFWEPNVSPHKLDLYHSLSRCPSVEATHYIAQRGLPDARSEEGWAVDYSTMSNLTIGPTKEQVWKVIRSSHPLSIHLFSGIHWVPCLAEGIAAAVAFGRRFGIMSEPRASEGLKGMARVVHSLASEAHVRRNAGFILAIGRHGPSWFQTVQYDPKKIFPFAYFVPAFSTVDEFEERTETRITFLGRINRNKGIHLFMNALPHVRHPVVIKIAGSGPDMALIQKVNDQLAYRLEYLGPIPMSAVPDLLQRTDILVLPSITTDDGWGVVVSEALLAGAAVVASDRAGASICLDDPVRGKVVTELSGKAVAAAINLVIESKVLSRSFREERAEWARARLTGEAGASYLVSILSHVYAGGERPPPFFNQ
jgi:glycosyltransferase involved in cell wall biosynthesis